MLVLLLCLDLDQVFALSFRCLPAALIEASGNGQGEPTWASRIEA
jgi:hypothetical protein